MIRRLVALVLVLGGSWPVAAQVTIADQVVARQKLAAGTTTPSASPLTVIGLPAGQTGGILRAGGGDGTIGTGPLVAADVPSVFTRRDVNETIAAAWTFAGGTLALTNGTSNTITYANTGVAPPSVGTRSAGTKAVYYSAIGPTQFDYAAGIEGGTLWASLPSRAERFVWYASDGDMVNETADQDMVAVLTGDRQFLPGQGYTGTIGAFNRKWLSLDVAELHATTLVAAETLTTTGGRQVVGTAAQLIWPMSPFNYPTADWLIVKQNNLFVGDYLIAEANMQFEAIRVEGYHGHCPDRPDCPAGVTGYWYWVTRDHDRSGGNAWPEGTTWFSLGAQIGHGFIDLYAQRGVRPSYSAVILGDRPVLYAPMEAAAGQTIPDRAVNPGAPGTLMGSGVIADWNVTASSPPGVALNNGGIGYFFNIPNKPAAAWTCDGSVEATFYGDPAASGSSTQLWHGVNGSGTALSWALVHAGADFGVPGGSMYVIAGAGGAGWNGVIVSPAIYPGWVRAVFTYARFGGFKLYVNGSLVGTAPPLAGNACLSPPDPAQGIYGYGPPNVAIDDLAIYNYVLTPEQVAYHWNAINYQSGAPSLDAGPAIVGNVRTGTGNFFDYAPRWAIGNIQGLYDYTTPTYGAAFGDPNAAWLGIDASRIRMMSGTTPLLTAEGGNLWLRGTLSMPTTGVIRSGNPPENVTGAFTGVPGFWLTYNQFRIGDPNGPRLIWNQPNLALVTPGLTITDYDGITLGGAQNVNDYPRQIRFSGAPQTTFGQWNNVFHLYTQGDLYLGAEDPAVLGTTKRVYQISNDTSAGNVWTILDATNRTDAVFKVVKSAGGAGAANNANIGAAGFVNYNGWTAAGGTPLVACGNFICVQASTERAKTNIEDWTPPALADLRAALFGLRPVTYTYRRDGDMARQLGTLGQTGFGYLAEDVVRQLPALVTVDRDGQPDGVLYDRVPLLLLPLLEDHERRLADLERRLETKP